MSSKKPNKAEYYIGRDVYGRTVTLTFNRDYMGKESWYICIEPSDQRADRQTISGLSDGNLRSIAAVINMKV